MSEHHKGPVAWQKFGKEYCLTGQYGMRPIILSVSGGKLMLRDQETDRLIPFSPEHPDAKFIVQAYNLLPKLVKALERVLDSAHEFKGGPIREEARAILREAKGDGA